MCDTDTDMCVNMLLTTLGWWNHMLHTPLYCGGKFWVAPSGHTPFSALRICWRRCAENPGWKAILPSDQNCLRRPVTPYRSMPEQYTYTERFDQKVLRSAVGIWHMFCGQDLWWTIPLHIFHWSCLLGYGPPIGVRFRESLVVRLHSEIDQIHLSIEAQCVTTLLPLGHCHRRQISLQWAVGCPNINDLSDVFSSLYFDFLWGSGHLFMRGGYEISKIQFLARKYIQSNCPIFPIELPP